MIDELYSSYCKNLLFKVTGIKISDDKTNLLYVKLNRFMRRKNISSYHDFYKLMKDESNTAELQEFINAFTTNTTSFFRERDHFDFIRNNLHVILNRLPNISSNSEIRVWCAACSNGQEAVTLAMVLKEFLPQDIQIKLLATDINSKVLLKASTGFYTFEEIKGISKYYLNKNFIRDENGFQVNNEILDLISYRQFNLMDEFNFKHSFDIVFLRNVMIYFSREVQQAIIDKMYKVITPGGLFFLGHSEALMGKGHNFSVLGPSVFGKQKNEQKIVSEAKRGDRCE